MKKLVSFIVLLLVSAFTVINALDIPLEKNTPPTKGTRQRAPMIIPVTANLSSTDMCLNFTSPVGIVTIKVTNSNGSTVYQKSTDTNQNSELYIPVDALENGNYTITISYNSTTLVGLFTI